MGLQNSRRWPLCKSANVGIAAENIAQTYWQEIPVRRLLWHWRPPRRTEIYDHVRSFAFKRWKRKKSHGARSGEYYCCLRYHLPIGDGWHAPTLELLRSCIQFWPLWPTTTLIILSSSKLSLPCANRWCHLNTALRPKSSPPYTCFILLNVSLGDLFSFFFFYRTWRLHVVQNATFSISAARI
jgi:hypothetical protein